MPVQEVTLSVRLKSSNAAVVDAPHDATRRALDHVKTAILAVHDNDAGIIRDANGNEVGTWYFEIRRGDK